MGLLVELRSLQLRDALTSCKRGAVDCTDDICASDTFVAEFEFLELGLEARAVFALAAFTNSEGCGPVA